MKTHLLLTVLNEAGTIARCINSAIDVGCTAVLVLDTGCTDDTIKIAHDVCFERGVKWWCQPHEWKDFSTARNALLEASEKMDPDARSLMLDADETVEGALPELGFAAGAYICRLMNDFEVWGVKFTDNSRGWRYKGEVHECPDWIGRGSVINCHSLTIINHADGRSGSATPEQVEARYLADAKHFLAELAAHPSDARSAYYFAQSLECAGHLAHAEYAYRRRVDMAFGFEEERYLAALKVAQLHIKMQRLPDLVTAAFETAIKIRPQRHEARVKLAAYLCSLTRYREALYAALESVHRPPSGDLFLVHRPSERWLGKFYMTLAMDKLHAWELSRPAARELLDSEHKLGQEYRAELENVWAGGQSRSGAQEGGDT